MKKVHGTMKRIIAVFVLGLALFGGAPQAQHPMSLPNGSFEQWTSHQGYSVTALFVPIQVYGSYSTPSLWDYPQYPVDETVSMFGLNINVNTMVPVIKASPETASVPDGGSAVRLQTFMLEDIVNSTVLSMASGSIDTSLVNEVIPSILSTGAVDIDAFLPLASDMMSGGGDLSAMLPTLLACDVNDFITGGIALGDFRPQRLTGSYKYHSASGGDNGGVFLLGTRYNPLTHKREIVGGGLYLGLVDTAEYVPFEVEYLSLGGVMSVPPDAVADSLVVLLISSAGANRQQGSYLCLDNLVLWSEPDTCAAVVGLTAVADIHEALLSWTVSDTVQGFEYEYGAAGFAPGSGTTGTSSSPSVTLEGLDAGTAYDVYVRTLCSDTIYGEWSRVQFTTLADTCSSVQNLTVVNQAAAGRPEAVLVWNGTSQPSYWEVEYGPAGFQQGHGSVAVAFGTRFAIYELENAHLLNPATLYDFYVRSVCSGGVYGSWDSVQYLTRCARVGNIAVSGVASDLWVAADGGVAGFCMAWTDTTGAGMWGVRYGISSAGQADGWGTYVEVDTPYFAFPPLVQQQTYIVEVTSLCGPGSHGDAVMVSFTTPYIGDGDTNAAIVAAARRQGPALTVSPNPACGRCVVAVDDGTPAVLTLYSVDGRRIMTVTSDGKPVEFDLPYRGLFLLHAASMDGTAVYRIVNR